MLSNTSSLLEQQNIFPQDAIFQIYYVTKDNMEDNNGERTSTKDHESLRWFTIVHDVTIRWLPGSLLAAVATHAAESLGTRLQQRLLIYQISVMNNYSATPFKPIMRNCSSQANHLKHCMIAVHHVGKAI